MTAGGAAATPVIFALFNWCNRSLGYQPRVEPGFRLDRKSAGEDYENETRNNAKRSDGVLE